MELTDHVKPAPIKETVRTYSPDEETTFITMVNDGALDEAIAEEIGKTTRGVKTMLTRRGLTAADYDGAAKAAKAG